MGVGHSESKTFLNITYGKLRQKTDESNPDAKKRDNKDGKTVYELVYDWVSGKISNIYFKEDKDFGNSFEVAVDDGKEKYQVSLKEGDSFFNDFFSKAPNLDFGEEVKLVPYDFEADGKRRRGMTVWQNNVKVPNYFQVKEGEEFVYLHGFPRPDSSNMDTEDWKIYFIKVTKFLRKYIQDILMPKLKNQEPTEEKEDLPF